MAGLVVVAGCSTLAQSVAGDAIETVISTCGPTAGRLDSAATLASGVGHYELTLVRRIDAVDVASTSGALVLYRQVPGLETLGNASTPLYGTAEVDLAAIGAHRVGDTVSDAPDAPGVLVLEWNLAGARNILLRLGSAANRRDTMLYDGAYSVLEVHEISADGFSGTWRSRSGSNSTRADGHFCAIRVTGLEDFVSLRSVRVIGGVRR